MFEDHALANRTAAIRPNIVDQFPLINFPLLLSKWGQQQLCVAENGEVGDSAQLIFKPHEPLKYEQN